MKVFPSGLRALDRVTLDLASGELHALCGENGAGKSTLARIAAGTLAPTSGSVTSRGPVGFVRQHVELVGPLRVWENVALGNEPRRGPRIDRDAACERVRELGARCGLTVDPDAIVASLPIGIAQRVEILRALAREPETLVLDEPTAVLAPAEIETLFAALRRLAAGGTAVLVITHKLAEAIAYATRVTVLRAGRVVLRTTTEATSSDAIARAMIGGDVARVAAREPIARTTMLAVRDLAAGRGAHALRGVSFDVRGGEIVGIVGVEGNGQTALCDAIAGRLAHRGTISLAGATLRPLDVGARAAAGARIVPQDRDREGLVTTWNVVDNAILGDHARPEFRRGATIDRRAATAFAATVVRDYDIRTSSLATPVAQLSGGNRQKLVVGRALAHAPRFVLAYQPTRGIDVGAAALVRSRLVGARNAGVAVLLVSFELDEVLALADRIVVLFRGSAVAEFDSDRFDRARIGAAMAGA